MEIHRRIWIALITMIVLAGCASQPVAMPKGTPSSQETESTPESTLPPESAGKTVASSGQIASSYPKLALTFGGDVSGQVLTITVKAGDVVQAGDLLALLNETDLQRAVEEAQIELERAIADRKQAQAEWEHDLADAEQTLAEAKRALTTAQLEYSETELEEARTNLERAKEAEQNAEHDYNEARRRWPPMPIDEYRSAWHHAIQERELAEMRLADAENAHNASYLDLDTYRDDVAEAERGLEALQDGVDPSYDRSVEDAERELQKARQDLEHTRLTAPWSAIVLSVDVAPQADVDTSTPIVTLLNVQDGLHFVTEDLNEQHIADVYHGQPAVVTLRTYPETSLEGTVEAVVPQVKEDASEETDAHFSVWVRLPPSELRLLPGLTGRVEIFTGQ